MNKKTAKRRKVIKEGKDMDEGRGNYRPGSDKDANQCEGVRKKG